MPAGASSPAHPPASFSCRAPKRGKRSARRLVWRTFGAAEGLRNGGDVLRNPVSGANPEVNVLHFYFFGRLLVSRCFEQYHFKHPKFKPAGTSQNRLKGKSKSMNIYRKPWILDCSAPKLWVSWRCSPQHASTNSSV